MLNASILRRRGLAAAGCRCLLGKKTWLAHPSLIPLIKFTGAIGYGVWCSPHWGQFATTGHTGCVMAYDWVAALRSRESDGLGSASGLGLMKELGPAQWASLASTLMATDGVVAAAGLGIGATLRLTDRATGAAGACLEALGAATAHSFCQRSDQCAMLRAA